MVEIIRRALTSRPAPKGLTLTRRVGECIYVDLPGGDQIRVTLSEIRKNQARIQVSAPSTCAVWRGELARGGA
jgi:carbon storage regulator CsrA